MFEGIPMSVLTIRLPEDKHSRLKQLAKARKLSINKLIDELATITLVEFDAQTRFRTLVSKGNPRRALAILKRLEADARGGERAA